MLTLAALAPALVAFLLSTFSLRSIFDPALFCATASAAT